MNLYAIVLRNQVFVAWIEFYWADNEEHANEQATNAQPHPTTTEILFTALVPYNPTRSAP